MQRRSALVRWPSLSSGNSGVKAIGAAELQSEEKRVFSKRFIGTLFSKSEPTRSTRCNNTNFWP
jgi:hypothetical protein